VGDDDEAVNSGSDFEDSQSESGDKSSRSDVNNDSLGTSRQIANFLESETEESEIKSDGNSDSGDRFGVAGHLESVSDSNSDDSADGSTSYVELNR
jgi:hypothetical protein